MKLFLDWVTFAAALVFFATTTVGRGSGTATRRRTWIRLTGGVFFLLLAARLIAFPS
jgi:hypothetical protein